MATTTVGVLVPAHNEAKTVGSVIDALVVHVPFLHEVIVVDDGSSDETAAIVAGYAAKDHRVRLVKHGVNRGKTEAINTAIGQSSADILLVQDADLEYSPEDIPDLIQPILDGKADVVYGSRFLVKRAARVLYFRHYLANKLLTFLSNIFTDMNFTDIETGYKAFRGDLLRQMRFQSSGFGFEVEVTARIAQQKCRVFEVPVSYSGRTYEEGKKIQFTDGLSAVYYIFRFNLVGFGRRFTRR
jgi:glycosyltransferase involved in cell wall biosynthesis